MKYFAKYLPVEGEIKETDTHFFNVKDNKLWSFKNHKHENVIELQEVYVDEYKRAKLFLCSRDIQVGDKIRYFENPFVEVEWTKHIDFSKSNTYTGADKPDAFKVIGEVSPDALSYVKEGDEFDEGQVNIILGYPIVTGQEKYYDTEYECYMQRDVYKYIARCQIKGPCGHYH